MELHTTDKVAHCQKSADKDIPQSTKSRAKPSDSTKVKMMLTGDRKTAHQQSILTFLSTAKTFSKFSIGWKKKKKNHAHQKPGMLSRQSADQERRKPFK